MGVTVSYNGSDIATLNENGTTILTTDNKFCVDDITIDYKTVTEVSISSSGAVS